MIARSLTFVTTRDKSMNVQSARKHRVFNMGRGTFQIPRLDQHNTIGAREAYQKEYGVTWPHSDEYLRNLGVEILIKNREPRCSDFVLLMRENSGQ